MRLCAILLIVVVTVVGCVSVPPAPIPPGLVSNLSRKALVEINSQPINVVLSWDYSDPNTINAQSNVMFMVFYSTNLVDWSLAGLTSNTTFSRVTDNQTEFYRVATSNLLTGEISPY